MDNRNISKLVKTKTDSKYLIIVLIMHKISGYVKTFKVKDKDNDKNNKLMSV